MGAGVFGEQLAVERLQPDGARLIVFAKQREGLAQSVPQVGRAVGGEVALGAAAQVGDGVVVGVYAVELGAAFGGLQQHAALFRRHQKQQPIHQPQQLAIVAFGGQRRLPVVAGRKGASQRLAVGMIEKAPAQGKQRALHAVAKLVAYAVVALNPVLIVALQQAPVGRRSVGGQARAVQQSV